VTVLARQAFRSLSRHPLRSTLTLLGFAIGVGAFVAMVSFADGARRSVVAQFEALGNNTLVIVAGAGTSGTVNQLFTTAEARSMASDVPGVTAAAPLARQIAAVSANGKQVTTLVMGTSPEFTAIRAWPFDAGGMFEREDFDVGARLCAIGHTVDERLFGADYATSIGQRLRIGDLDCRVVGVLASLGQAASSQDQDDVVLVPLPLFERRVVGRTGADRLLIGLVPDGDPKRTREAVRAQLRERRRLAPGAADDFTVRSPDDLVRVAERTAGLLQGLLGAIAAVSLLVGGIGIMNILLVSVGERTREIGVRMALGATPRNILGQFLIEAVTLSGAGALAGAALGAVLSLVVGARLGFGVAFPLDTIAFSLLGGVALGVVFGLYPARRASLLDPIVALRGE
jgi:putative ABC transport system permease protein